ncbi:hypothetical protein [Sphingobium sp. LSP13-1-1.1]|uniref:hypothetical protein n=1 Tax=Sphingobium sp. LSP13-1-1.1 TaxID=3135234 RepID=UPI003449ECC9
MAGADLVGPSDPPSLDGLEEDEAVEAMVDWFAANYEDPAQSTPYDSSEGGYQYIWGGPYDAEEEIWGAFPDADEEWIARAVDEVQNDGTFDWAPNSGRVQEVEEDFEDDDYDQAPSLNERLNALGEQLDRIEQHIEFWQNRPAGMGHNAPPEEFQLSPDDIDLVEARESVAEVRAELAKPDRETSADLEVVERAESRFKKLAARILNFCKKPWAVAGAVFIGDHIADKAFDAAWDNPDAFYSALHTAGHTLALWGASIIGI